VVAVRPVTSKTPARPKRVTAILMLRYRRVENLTGESPKLSWHGTWSNQYGNLYRRTLVWHPGFWWFVLFAEKLEGMRMQALKFYWKDRRSYIGGNKRA
jgi:hypothetical protein